MPRCTCLRTSVVSNRAANRRRRKGRSARKVEAGRSAREGAEASCVGLAWLGRCDGGGVGLGWLDGDREGEEWKRVGAVCDVGMRRDGVAVAARSEE